MDEKDQEKLAATIDFLRRTGAKQVQIRYSDDEQPVVWFVVVKYDGFNPGGTVGFETDAAATPLAAALRLCERVGDGGKCAHCNRPTGFEPNLLIRMPMDDKICWYQFDPELKTFRRGCEGDT